MAQSPSDRSCPARQVVHSRAFELSVFFIIVLNTVLLSAIYFGMPPGYVLALNVLNGLLAGCFLVEAAMKLYGMGFWDWSEDWLNWLDAAIALISVVDVALSIVASGNR